MSMSSNFKSTLDEIIIDVTKSILLTEILEIYKLSISYLHLKVFYPKLSSNSYRHGSN